MKSITINHGYSKVSFSGPDICDECGVGAVIVISSSCEHRDEGKIKLCESCVEEFLKGIYACMST